MIPVRQSLVAVLTMAIAGCSAGDQSGPVAAKPAFVNAGIVANLGGTAGVALPSAPTFTVTDASGNSLSGIAVNVTVTAGGGTLAGSPTSSAKGATPIGTWTLGKTAGLNTITVAVTGLTPVVIAATGNPGAPAAITVVSGNNQSAFAGTVLALPAVLKVTDQFGNAIAGGSMVFTLSTGGGSLMGSTTAVADANGTVTAPQWKLGNLAIPQALSVTSGALSTSVLANVTTNFSPSLRFFGPPVDPSIQSAFTRAIQRAQGMITGGLEQVNVRNLDVAANCGVTGVAPLTETVSDVIIFATVKTIDGVGKILGSSGPCYIRDPSNLPVVGVMTFDVADFQGLVNDGRLDEVVLHEMQHVFGFGTLWSRFGLIVNAASPLTAYTGIQGILGCQATGGGSGICLPAIPLENLGGSGTRDGHWRRAIFGNELMTGFVGPVGFQMPLSAMTIGALGDLGYIVNANVNDSYSTGSALSMSLQQLRMAQGLDPSEMSDTPLPPVATISRRGIITRIARQ
jgi:hypothetical protein